MEKQKSKNKIIISSLIMATILWFVIFVLKPFNFWIEMGVSILVLVMVALFSEKNLISFRNIKLRHILIGIISAIILYFVFYAGNIISGYLFPFKDAQIASVYSNRAQGNSLLIGALLLFIIGPGEEIYWRGFIQNNLAKKFGEDKGYIFATLLYAGVHIITLNFMLVVAALVCGIYWGWIYKKEKSLVPIIISHAIWDFTVFVLFPLM
ncbi:CPBP family intramembrane glutamic endopeptidase [Clostridium beijerinckii]|uniref:CAAX protease family protein n=1 Tax=Clostridium beijerinckii TaxID=1520 RepID=A0A1S9N4N9_CLOBE|nr:type II CAAX endopeptidase family protein [Clostridium beijerinckii]MZK51155.1 CPBP family intramembrane metalloprotease [Clostridium beijerinckii]MZK59357.1 CPBP family intramembrane metalloprotease [Clostridium beijerinckii]MZK69476.1 CPBP family intramembrane metalloprotease [Clostridium beijerinckii]MZK74850.1 CPBP family intramembrane metalloprotease [Clostridium beijerinckii]MZK84567.1 CPBP family intramembrane metalloprotease [Clostridium beijerinckii]